MNVLIALGMTAAVITAAAMLMGFAWWLVLLEESRGTMVAVGAFAAVMSLAMFALFYCVVAFS